MISSIVTVHREQKIMGFAVKFSVWLNGDKVGGVKNGQEITFSVPEGTHSLAMRNGMIGSNDLTITATNGQELHVLIERVKGPFFIMMLYISSFAFLIGTPFLIYYLLLGGRKTWFRLKLLDKESSPNKPSSIDGRNQYSPNQSQNNEN